MPTLTPVMRKFILHWGEMGTRWGINRTVAQIHALLYVSEKPLPAEEIAATLSVARSNVSTSLRELQNWGLVNLVHLMGDRRDHFETMKDVWEMFRTILEERRRREVEPTLTILRECVSAAEAERGGDRQLQRRLADMLGFFETMTHVHEQIWKLPTGAVSRMAKMGAKIPKLLGLTA